ncbi:Asp/Glu/hydantoin racemase [Pacificitalea manganoxidans]|uniref:Asp/Glu/hydantoin racemase n=1 Tax=Pacificitalea manganoxidans TaxID=1411902 RepID=A0A291LXY9_9RHOB|nr:aspartate/glutamate racemase family protein [Pacificitalea manganoxidans]ATI41378.1 Asp/Glu/hydantoin racemase [Pacificitalea manganoxidans]MDR6308787.1 Asp/Glu/hydantoin racemase [Pacificitalea manganoxidans]
MGKIVVVNPNSSAVVTAGIAEALRPFGDHFEVTDLPEGPATIATEEDVARAAIGFAELAQTRPDALAFVTACFSDPGLDLARSLVPQPVIGVQEAGILTALGQADLFGIIALSARSIPRHRRRMRMMGVLDRLAGELPLPDVSAEDSGRDEALYAHLLSLATQLGEMGAGAVVLGCAGMGPVRARLEADTGLAIIDPVTAAGGMALARVIDHLPVAGARA